MSIRSLTWASLALLLACATGPATGQRRAGLLTSIDLASTSLDQALTAEERESAESLGPDLTWEFSATPLGDTLTAIFARTSCTFRLDDPRLADLIVTMRIKDTPWLWALQEVLDQYSLTYDEEGGLYRISPLSSEQVASTQRELGADKQAMLYVTDYGEELRLRVFPYLGSERVQWPGTGESRLWYYLPSPSFDYVALFVGRFPTRVFVQELATRRTREVATGMDIEYGLWQGENALHLLSTDCDYTRWTESVYDPQTRRMTTVRTYPRETESQLVAFLSAPFAKQIEALENLIRGRESADGRDIVVPLTQDDAAGAILRGAGIPYVPSVIADLPVTHSVAAVSPDGTYLGVTTGKYVVFIIFISEYGSKVARVIPLTGLVNGESVWVEDLRWSTDSTHLTFTEVHSHPSGTSIAPGVVHFVPDPLDWTRLVRMYNLPEGDGKGDRVETVAVGSNAFLVPESVPVPSRP